MMSTPASIKTALSALAPLLAAGAAAAFHRFVPSARPDFSGSAAYLWLLAAAAALWTLYAAAAFFSQAGRGKIRDKAPILAAAFIAFIVWQTLTSKTALLPMPFFPGPEKVFTVLSDKSEVLLLAKCVLHSFRLLAVGFFCGAFIGFLLGVCVGWSRWANYWIMPALRFFGPVPSTAFIPLALVLFPTAFGASSFIIALAALFPMTVLTASGIANTRHSHLEVARTLGASRWQLIRRVAIPSAQPSIFVGLFMALSASFITLIVAEMIGVKAGLGFYIEWAKNFAEYYKVFAALLLMGVFFSSLMTALFRIRDRVLSWQQGVIKW